MYASMMKCQKMFSTFLILGHYLNHIMNCCAVDFNGKPAVFTLLWRHQMETFSRYWPCVRGIHRSTVNFPYKGQWRGVLMFTLICSWINVWVNNGEAGDFRRHRTHYDVIIMVWNIFSPEAYCDFHCTWSVSDQTWGAEIFDDSELCHIHACFEIMNSDGWAIYHIVLKYLMTWYFKDCNLFSEPVFNLCKILTDASLN